MCSESVSVVLFVAAVVAGIASWFLGIAEFIGMWRFWPWVFRTGIRVLRETHSINVPIMRIDSVFETESGWCKFVAPRLCLFRCRMHWFGLDWHTPFPIKGSVRWDGTRANVEGPIPLFSTVFFGAWVIAWTVGGNWAVLHEFVAGMSFLVLGWLFAGGICLFSISFEIRRAQRILGELEEALS